MKKLLVALIFLFLLALFFIRAAGPLILSRIMTEQLGVPVMMGRLELSLVRSSFKLHSIEIQNPPEYRQRSLAVIREIDGVFDWGGFFRNELRLKTLTVKMDSVSFEKSDEGRLNWIELAALASQSRKSKTPSLKRAQVGRGLPPQESVLPSERKPLSLKIDQMRLSVKKIYYFNPVSGDSQSWEDPIKETEFRNVHDLALFIQQLSVQLLSQAGLASILPDLGRLSEIMADSGKVPIETLKSRLDSWLGKGPQKIQ